MNDDQAALLKRVTEKYVDEGRLIEAGWQTMRLLVVPPTAPRDQLTEMRKAYFTGAQHLFASLMTVMSDGDGEPAPADLRRVDLIDAELKAFVAELRAEIGR